MIKPDNSRLAYSPSEFAALFGKSITWSYRQLYAGKVKAITEHGRIMIPAKEAERMLANAKTYNGREKPKSRAEPQPNDLTQAHELCPVCGANLGQHLGHARDV